MNYKTLRIHLLAANSSYVVLSKAFNPLGSAATSQSDRMQSLRCLLRSKTIACQEVLHDLVTSGGVVMEVQAVTSVRLNVRLESRG